MNDGDVKSNFKNVEDIVGVTDLFGDGFRKMVFFKDIESMKVALESLEEDPEIHKVT